MLFKLSQDEFDIVDTEYGERCKRADYAPCHYSVLEFAENGGLLPYLQQSDERKQGLRNEDARVLFQQLLSAVHFLHLCGVAHLDIKVDNLLLGKPGSLKLTDFGMARMVASCVLSSGTMSKPKKPAKPLMQSGRPGTLRYMAPEVFDCQGDFDAPMGSVCC